MRKQLVFTFLCLCCFYSFSQTMTAKLLDTQNEPVPFATIKTGVNKGVISNEEGVFTIDLSDIENNAIEVSCLGFATVTLSIEDLKSKNNTIILEEYINELNQVFVSNGSINALDIIQKVNQNLSKNYKNRNQTYKLFFRKSSNVNFKRLNTEIKKASGIRKKHLANANLGLDSLNRAIQTSNAIHFKDYLADLYVKDNTNSKLNVYKITSLLDKKKNFSVDNIQEKAQTIILKYLDTTKTYKIKTGLLKIEDSLDLKESRKNSNRDTYDIAPLKDDTFALLSTSQNYEETLLTTILNPDEYEYEFEGTTGFNNELVYILKYEPRRSRSKFAGKLYIADETFAVLKLDYGFAKGKRGEKVNLKLLLGIKYEENLKRGTIIFKKSDQGTYHPHYIKEERGNFFYINRPLKFIENSRAKNKVTFNFLIEGGAREKREMFIINSADLDPSTYSSFKQPQDIKFEKLSYYDPSIWKAYNAIEPLEEMKQFKSSED